MPRIARRLVVSAALAVTFLFYVFSSRTSTAHSTAQRSSADERLNRFVSPESRQNDLHEAARNELKIPTDWPAPGKRPAVPIQPFPLARENSEPVNRVTGGNSLYGSAQDAQQERPAAPKKADSPAAAPPVMPQAPVNAHHGQTQPQGGMPARGADANGIKAADSGQNVILKTGGKTGVDALEDSAVAPAAPAVPAVPAAPAAPAADPVKAEDTPAELTEEQAKAKTKWDNTKYEFQLERKFEQPKTDLGEFARLHPHNYNEGAEGKTLATYLCTRDSSIDDPYFSATLQLVYRNLWDPKSRSNKYPFTVFVAPHIPELQRNMLAGAGANVRELPLLEWNPDLPNVMSRWRDLFSKLHMWNQTDFSRIVFMDSDAFSIRNIDDIFDADVSPVLTCREELLDPEDMAVKEEICSYVYAGVEIGFSREINVGVLVVEPNRAMHARLLRNFPKTENYDSGMAEQSFLNWQFRESGPFPKTFLDRKYNGFFPGQDEAETLRIVHEKLWIFKTGVWTDTLFDDTWKEMIAFYDSVAFREGRMQDDLSRPRPRS